MKILLLYGVMRKMSTVEINSCLLCSGQTGVSAADLIRHGSWKVITGRNADCFHFRCSECGANGYLEEYCSDCNAKMDRGIIDETD